MRPLSHDTWQILSPDVVILPLVDIVSSLFFVPAVYPTRNSAPLEKGSWPGPGPSFGPNIKVIPSHTDSPIFSLTWAPVILALHSRQTSFSLAVVPLLSVTPEMA